MRRYRKEVGLQISRKTECVGYIIGVCVCVCVFISLLTRYDNSKNTTAVCVASVDPMQLAITVDNIASELYVDGVLTSLPNYNDWTQVDTITIPADTGVIAVKGTDKGVSYSFI